MTSVVRCWIKNLEHMREDTQNVSIIAVIIVKSQPRFFDGDEQQRGVLNMTLRDTVKDTINCTIWGTRESIMSTNENFRCGQVVNVVGARISQEDASVYRPKTSSSYVMILSDARGKIMQYIGTGENFSRLLHIPLKPQGLMLSLMDVNSKGELVSAEFVDLMVIVRMIRPLREIKTRMGKITHCREIIVMDRTFPGMLLTFWGKDDNERIDQWKPLETCLHLYDVKSDYSTYYRSVILTYCSRTVILDAVRGPEVDDLREFAANVPPIERFSFECNDLPCPDEIRNVMTIQQIQDRAEGYLMGNEEQFTAVIYATVVFDLDASNRRIVTERCPVCKQIVEGGCPEANCASVQFQMEATQRNLVAFEIFMSLTDHTGSLPYCRLMSSAAEKLLEMSPEDFLKLPPELRTQLKWQTILERCTVKVVVRKKSIYRPRMWIGIVECSVAAPEDVIRSIKVY
ncbi:protein hold'em [Lutzomyia longipalpis]|uniref:protein hold'em n=1 Tax=Lutzomyia longipalpis TaxID=7200 RepID=UPI00248450EE|nr:protein hold'em [Lutzomyia longipalpis]